MSRFALVSLCCIVFLSTAGCGDDNPDVYPVAGKVTFEGVPMPLGGSIAFIPAEGQFGAAAGGTIEPDGSYRLSTYGDGDGAIAGKHKVMITQLTDREPGTEEMPEDGSAQAAQPLEGTLAVPKSMWIPDHYSNPANTPLTTTVEEIDANVINFELTQE